ncbi:hypothetical protein VNI00_008431 [Paramarasmius palmivorus]|uniref:Uncharacterized protein n=1 Tax=Paramarasmius palmivorus TaxID=297713 RepID=A0AAW0CW34_9AGAR
MATPKPPHSRSPHGIHAPSARPAISTQRSSSSPSVIPTPTPKRNRQQSDPQPDLPPVDTKMALQTPARPPSRSEFLLRETLLRDELTRDRDKGDERSGLGMEESRAGPSSGNGHRRRASLNRSMTESELPRPRPSLSRATSPSRLPLTPHEQVLRARLERVLSASSMLGYPTPSNPYANEEARSSRPKHVKRASLPGPGSPWNTESSTPSSSESIDYDQELYLPTPLSANSRAKRDMELLATGTTMTRSRSRTEPSRPAPRHSPSKIPTPSHQSPRYSRSRSPITSHSKSHSHPPPQFTSDVHSVSSSSSYDTHLHSDKGKGRVTEDESGRRTSEPEMITPPPTPPTGSSVKSLPISMPSHGSEVEVPRTDIPSTPRKFDAQLASQQCRQLQGYVSFASVEGLGEPAEEERDTSVGAERKRWLGLF